MENLTKRNGRHTTNIPKAHLKPVRTLAIDIGASGIKALVLNELGEPVTERAREKTPEPGKPDMIMETVIALAKRQGKFDRVSVGFPGVVRNGVVKDAPNLAPEWKDFNVAKFLSAKFNKPVKVVNDADMQGFGAISGSGVEMVMTLGTGVGSSLFVDGRLVPNVEIGKDKLSDAALMKAGRKKWNKRVAKAALKLESIFNYDRLYIGGGNARLVDISILPANVTIVSNLNGLVGGMALWRESETGVGSQA
ncbi:MAG: ROK family protein, partial [Nitrospiraceae bacterium]